MTTDGRDLQAVHAAIGGIAQLNDRADWLGYGASFSDDAVLHCFGREYEGRDAIVRFTTRRIEGKHILSLPVVDLSDNRATAHTDYVLYRYPDLALFAVGVYFDELVKRDDRWPVVRREIVVHAHHADMTAAGNQRPPL